MPSDRNKETRAILKQEIKAIQSRCVETCSIINNAPQEFPATDQEEVVQKALCYVEGLKIEVQNSNTPLLTDENLLTSQFLNEIIDKTGQIEELTAYTKGVIHDLDDEITRLKTQIHIAQEVKSRPRVQKQEITPEHLDKAKERFQLLKSELQSLINSMFPDYSGQVMEFMGNLMAAKLNQTTNGYLPITSENYQIVELLRDIDILTTNPYNNMEVKLAY